MAIVSLGLAVLPTIPHLSLPRSVQSCHSQAEDSGSALLKTSSEEEKIKKESPFKYTGLDIYGGIARYPSTWEAEAGESRV